MSIRKRIIFITIVVSALFIFLLAIGLRFILFSGFSEIEDKTIERNLLMAENGLNQRMRYVESITKDWAVWDDSYNYILGRKKDYISNNISPNVLANLGVNFIILTNNKKKIVFVFGIDIESGKEKDFSKIAKFIVSDTRFKPETSLNGIISIPNQYPIIISSQPILKTNGNGPPVGSLIFGRFIDKEIIRTITEATLFPLTIRKIDSVLDVEFKEAFSALQKEEIFIKRESSNMAYGYLLLKDVYGKDSFFMRIGSSRAIYQQEIFLAEGIILFFVFGSILYLIIFLIIIDRNILNRLKKLIVSIKKVGATADLGYIADFGEKDEIEVLSKQIKRSFSQSDWIEEQVKKGEAEYRKIFELSPEAIVVLDRKGEMIDVNSRINDWLGYKKEEVLGKHILTLPFLNRQSKTIVIKKFIQRMRGKNVPPYDLEFIDKKNKIHIGRIRAKPIRDENKKIIGDLVLIEDVTLIRESEKKLKESERMYRDLFDNASDLIQSVDSKGNFLYVNHRWHKVLGYSEKEIKKINLFDIIHKNQLPHCRKLFKKLIAGESLEKIEVIFKTKNGKEVILEGSISPRMEDGKFVAARGIFRDITEKKESEIRLKNAKEKLEREKTKDEAIIENIAEGLIVTDENKNILVFNKTAQELLGWTSKEIVGKNFFEKIKLVDENNKEMPEAKRPLELALSGKKNFIGGVAEKYYYLKKDKNKFPVAILTAPLILGNKIIGVVEVFRDVTKEKEIDKAKTEFVSMASHQLRTPLTTINWYLEMLLDKEVGEISKNQEEYLKSIYGASRRMTELVSALLNVARIELGTFAIEPRKVRIEKIADSVIEELLPKIQKKKIKLRKYFEENLPIISTDPKLTRIILQNLLSNAVKYTKENRGKVLLKIKKQKNNILIRVSDNGYGIPEKDKSKIFTKLFRADNIKTMEPDGTGLGLYIVKGIVDGYGGDVWFKSKENKGVTFSVLIPTKIKRKKGSKKITILK